MRKKEKERGGGGGGKGWRERDLCIMRKLYCWGADHQQF